MKFWLAAVSCLFLSVANVQAAESVLRQLSKTASPGDVLKSTDEEMKKVSEKFQSLMIDQGFADKECKTICSVSCTWVDGKCQATTTCSLQCGF